MQKLKLSIALLFLTLAPAMGQGFVEPFSDYFSFKECYVITVGGEEIRGNLRGATDARGFIKKLTIVDADGKKHKFKAKDIQRFAIKPDAVTKLNTLNEKSTSVRHVLTTDHDDLLDREWIYFDAQVMPRSKKVGLLQLLNPGFDEFVKVYHHPNGSKSMGLGLRGINIVGGEERTYLVAKEEAKPEIVRKASYDKTFESLFADQEDMLKSLKRKPKFKDFAGHIQAYNELRYQSLLSKK